jgi:predicted nuclease of predicted toxin-antitoxin system
VNIKLDENLPDSLVSPLKALGHDVDTVPSEHLAGRDDNEVWQAAQAADRFLITQDLDFSDVRRFTPGTHAGLLLVRLAQPGRKALAARVALLFATERVDEWRGCLVVATEHKVPSQAACLSRPCQRAAVRSQSKLLIFFVARDPRKPACGTTLLRYPSRDRYSISQIFESYRKHDAVTCQASILKWNGKWNGDR